MEWADKRILQSKESMIMSSRKAERLFIELQMKKNKIMKQKLILENLLSVLFRSRIQESNP
jgi:hypothetical protein